MEFFDPQTIEMFVRLSVAMFLGLILGIERVFAHKTAGMRTYALVSMGSALFVVISGVIAPQYLAITNFDPLRMAAHIITGIGFIGAGLIIFRGDQLRGITTAAGLWVAAGIGIASGFGLYSLALFATLLTLFVFTILWFIESKIKKISNNIGDDNDDENE